MELMISPKKLMNPPKSIFRILIYGFMIRLILLIILLIVKLLTDLEPYLYIDDVAYEQLALFYMNNAKSIVDYSVFVNSGASGYLNTFWPWVVSISAYITKSIYTIRFINIILSTFTIYIIYKIVYSLSKDDYTSKLAAKLYAFMPYAIIPSLFPIKDVFIAFSVFYILEIFLRIQIQKKIKFYEVLMVILLLYFLWLTRGAITEFLILICILLVFNRFIKSKKYTYLLIFLVVSAIIFFVFGNQIILSFEEKIAAYFSYSREDSNLALIRIDTLYDFWKFPFTFFFALLQPLSISLQYVNNVSLYSNLLSYLNIIAIPIAIGNMIYIFIKKHNFIYWFTTLILYFSVIVLSLGISRHYMFLLPLTYINFALFVNRSKHKFDIYVFLGSIIIFSFIIFWTIFTII